MLVHAEQRESRKEHSDNGSSHVSSLTPFQYEAPLGSAAIRILSGDFESEYSRPNGPTWEPDLRAVGAFAQNPNCPAIDAPR